MNIYKEVRQLRQQGRSQRSIAVQLGISRNTVKKYWEGEAVPWVRKEYQRPTSVLTEGVKNFIQQCLDEDEENRLKKQSHTAKRIYDRLVEEQSFTGGESTVRRYVQELRGSTPEAFVPLAFDPGDAVQVDWGEATIRLADVKTKVNIFCARLCYSDAPFVVAYRRQNSESFLEAQVRTFDYFGGAPRRVIFDNAKIAVKDGFGAHAKTQDSYAMLAAHYGFETVFCNPASGNEKGLVEGLVGFSRRNFCVPLPKVDSMDELNDLLQKRCEQYLKHTIRGKNGTVREEFEVEKAALNPLPIYRFDPAKRAHGRVDRFSTVRFDTNNYSVPVTYCGKEVTVKALPEQVEIYSQNKLIATHPRCLGHKQNVYDLQHYLPLLERKGRAIFQAKPVRDTVPPVFLAWLQKQNLKPKQIVELLYRCLDEGFDTVMQGVSVVTPPPPKIADTVVVQNVNLAGYDVLFGGVRV
ncbi:IS21 family transposase [Bengtsoniella intestinalis]|uniref:IS21 family transposase n=1 Tax=Bengtsoniella intestinalis TaxID=3073143 RepID=UPI00391F1AF5